MSSKNSQIVQLQQEIAQYKIFHKEEKQKYENRISNLLKELASVKLELEQNKQELYQSNLKKKKKDDKYNLHSAKTPFTPSKRASIVLEDLVDPNDYIEDNVSDESSINDDNKGKCKGKAHLRGATSMIIEDLVGISDNSSNSSVSSSGSASSSSSGSGSSQSQDASASNLHLHIAESMLIESMIEKQKISENDYQHINDITVLKNIIKSLKIELQTTRINQLAAQTSKTALKEETIDLNQELNTSKKKYKKLLRKSQQFSVNFNPFFLGQNNQNNNKQLQNNKDVLIQSKIDLIQSLSKEFNKMRDIIKKQQKIIDSNKNNGNNPKKK